MCLSVTGFANPQRRCQPHNYYVHGPSASVRRATKHCIVCSCGSFTECCVACHDVFAVVGVLPSAAQPAMMYSHRPHLQNACLKDNPTHFDYHQFAVQLNNYPGFSLPWMCAALPLQVTVPFAHCLLHAFLRACDAEQSQIVHSSAWHSSATTRCTLCTNTLCTCSARVAPKCR